MITLIGKELAKEGVSFVFYEPAEECSECRFKASCVDSLKKGHRYTITEVRDVEQKCPVHENDKVQVVAVENAEFTILTQALTSSVKDVQIRTVTIGICASQMESPKRKREFM